jgi:hypothetical protein
MAQKFIADSDAIFLNDKPIIYSGFISSFAVAPDTLTIYAASSLPYLRKYVKTYDDVTRLFNWVLDESFKFVSLNVSQFLTGLLLNGADLYISTSNNNGVSKILKVNAENGNQILSVETGENISEIYSTINAGLSNMTIGNGDYLYVANTGNFNSGRSIHRVGLQAGLESTEDWITNLTLAPIQLGVYDNYLCVLGAEFFSGEKIVEVFSLDEGLLVYTLKLHESDNLSLGLSLVESFISLIGNNNFTYYTFDLSKVISGTTEVLEPIIDI